MLRIMSLFTIALLSGCANLSWTPDPKTYLPAPASQIDVEGFGIDAPVDILTSGQLPITITRTLTNAGSVAIPAGYTVTETVQRMKFQAINPTSWEWVEVGDPQYVYFACTTTGPALAPGQQADISFTFPGPNCVGPPPPANPSILDCGLYKETLAADVGTAILESDEGDNETEHFFYVPSSQGRLNMVATPNPTNDPNIDVVPVPRPPTVQIDAKQYPPPGPVTVTAWRVDISSAPPTAGWIVNGIAPVVKTGAVGNLIPPMQIIDPAPAAPRSVSYTVDIDPTRAEAIETVDSKVTAITTDGCQIRQRSLRTKVFWVP
jgi:hypothetical protein